MLHYIRIICRYTVSYLLIHKYLRFMFEWQLICNSDMPASAFVVSYCRTPLI